MNYRIHITIHVYAEDRAIDDVLIPNNDNYGILGKDEIVPLRKINGNDLEIKNVSADFTVNQLWIWIGQTIYADKVKHTEISRYTDIPQFDIIEKYLVFNDLRYAVEQPDKPLLFYLHRMGMSEKDVVQVQLLVCEDAGEVFRDDGICYYIKSREGCNHNEPHVHVDIHHELTGVFSLIDGKQLSGDTFRKSYLNVIYKTIMEHQKEWLVYWNQHTDGLTVDLNQVLGKRNF